MEIRHNDRIDTMIKCHFTDEEPWTHCNCDLKKNTEEYKEDTKMHKSCDNCKYHYMPLFSEPCVSCNLMKNMWEPKEDKKMEKFTKSMLKDSMVVEIRDGNRFLVCGDKLISMSNGMIYLSHYDDDLLYIGSFLIPSRPGDKTFDIIKVYDKVDELKQVVSLLCLHLLWERKPEVKEVTLKEIAEKFGVDEVKVIDEN